MLQRLVTDAEHVETLSVALSFRRRKTSIESAPDNALICIMAPALSGHVSVAVKPGHGLPAVEIYRDRQTDS